MNTHQNHESSLAVSARDVWAGPRTSVLTSSQEHLRLPIEDHSEKQGRQREVSSCLCFLGDRGLGGRRAVVTHLEGGYPSSTKAFSPSPGFPRGTDRMQGIKDKELISGAPSTARLISSVPAGPGLVRGG